MFDVPILARLFLASPWHRLGCTALALVLSAALAVPVHAQQTIAEARDQGSGATVTVEGTVTRAFGAYVRFQDDSGPTGASALVLRQTSGSLSGDVQQDIEDGTIAPGTRLQVSGTLSEFGNLLQINGSDLTDYTVQGQGDPPAPQQVSLADLEADGEQYESELVAIPGLSLRSTQGTFDADENYTVTDGTTTLLFRVQGDDESAVGGTPVPEGSFNYEGVTGQFFDDYQLIPVRPSDLQPATSFSFGRLFAEVLEGEGAVQTTVGAFNTEGRNVTVTARVGASSTATNGTDVTGFASPQTFTFSGSDPAPQTLTFDVVDDGDEEGVERLVIVLESDDGGIAAPARFTLWIRDDGPAQGSIAAGQTGDALVETLETTYGNPPTIGYDIARDTLYRTVYNENGEVEGIYTGLRVPVDPDGGDASEQAGDGGINTEHIWPRSQGSEEEPALSNMHILAPARGVVNTARSNYAFGEIPDAETDRWYVNDQSRTTPPPSNRELWSELDNSPGNRAERRFEPRESVKGDVARAVFYFVTAYPARADLQFYEQQKETLFEWHQDDPVDAAEARRNILKAAYQGNKLNPFIVDPTLIDRAYISGGGSPGSGTQLPIAEARQEGSGATVTVEGTVTRAYGDFVRLQDDSGPTGASALVVRQTSGDFHDDVQSGTIRPGVRMQVTGTLSEFRNLLQINEGDLSSYALQDQVAVPAPQSVSLSTLQSRGEDYESELVRIRNLAFVSASGTFQADENYTVTDDGGTTTLTFRVQGSDESQLAGASIPTGSFTYEGVVGQFEADYQLIPIRPATALPVELAAFDAVRDGSRVTLTWTTASETNNAGFDVQRRVRTDATGKDGSWTTLGRVEGAGTTTDPQVYRFTDATPPFEARTLTYRLKQVDLDGTASYSAPVTVQQTVDGVTLRAPFPNPARGQATVQFAVPERQRVTIRLYDVLGRQVQTLVDGPREGRASAQVDVRTLPSGVYFLRLQAGGAVRTTRLTVVK